MEHLEGPRLKKLQRISPPHSNATGGEGPLRRGRGRHWLRAQHISLCAPRRPAGLALHPYPSSLRSSQTAVTLSSTINTDTQLAQDMWTTCPRNPSPPGKHTRGRLNPASPTSCLSAPLAPSLLSRPRILIPGLVSVRSACVRLGLGPPRRRAT